MYYIRNFCIIAHIDHGKSTLADRILEYTKTISSKLNIKQILDNMDLERERGITIKSHAIQMKYKYNNKLYTLNLIDTPGHVDFSYEVSRSINSCEGALLVIDCTKSIQSQTISNLSLALNKKLCIIPVLNKIDIPISKNDLDKVLEEIVTLLKCKKEDIILSSAKEGIGINKILDAIINKIPHPNGDKNKPLKAVIFDSLYNPFRGIEIFFKVINGCISVGQKLKFISTGNTCYANELGNLGWKKIIKSCIYAGDVGHFISGIKDTKKIKVGDTITDANNPTKDKIDDLFEIQPMVFSSIYATQHDKYEDLKSSIEKLHLNDSSIVFKPESSPILGMGFRCGFLGILHMEIFKDRLEREYGISIILTIPSVSYKVFIKNKPILIVNHPSEFPENININKVEEPYVMVNVLTKTKYIGKVISLCIEKRGVMKDQNYLTDEKIKITFEFPLSEIISDFYDKLKTISNGYSSFDYKFIGYKTSHIKKINVIINYEKIHSFATLAHKNKAYVVAREICKKLSKLIPKHQFNIPIQTSISGRIIARETIKSLRKNVTEKCYGGDITRKKKLLNKQKQGKKRMRHIGKVAIPSSAFMTFLKKVDK